MDKINFLATDDFPVSSDTLNRLQEATNMVSKLALQVGVNYKLSGCEITGSKAAPGVIVLDGEILPFLGGEIQPEIAIQETKITLDAFDVKYPEAYINRIAVFAAEGVYKWDDLKKVPTNQELDDRISSLRGEPLAIKHDYTGRVDRIPNNYMLADGRILKTAEYPELAWFYGAENLESFRLPDLRKYFIVGYDPRHKDYSEIGETGGSEEVTLGIPNIPKHDHVKNRLFNKLSAKAGDVDEQASPGSVDRDQAAREYNVASMTEDRWEEATIQPVGEGKPFDIRPTFYALAYIIKVKY